MGRNNGALEQYGRLSEQVNTKIWYQSAWHGGAVNFDKFDLGYALSGEGAMVHGYGVYLAQNRDVSEGYRRKLSNSFEDIYYNGEKLDVKSLKYSVIDLIRNFGNDYRLAHKEYTTAQQEKFFYINFVVCS